MPYMDTRELKKSKKFDKTVIINLKGKSNEQESGLTFIEELIIDVLKAFVWEWNRRSKQVDVSIDIKDNLQ